MSLIPYTWQPIGPAPIQDPLNGRLGFANQWGDLFASGAVNGLQIVQQDNGDAFLYAGTVNGGLWMRPYTYATDSWGQWTWQNLPSNDPNTGYQGIPSIAEIAVSPDSQYLVVGQGNPSNFNAQSSGPSVGIQFAEILDDGTLNWLILDSTLQRELQGDNIRDLTWVGDRLFVVARTKEGTSSEDPPIDTLTVLTVNNGVVVETTPVEPTQDQLLQSASTPEGGVYTFGIQSLLRYFDPSSPTQPVTITGDNPREMYLSWGSSFNNFRLSAYPQTLDGQTILFIGVSSGDRIGKITRAVLDGSELVSFQTFDVENNLIGSGQASGAKFYGNFSFVADPSDPLGLTVLAGGNQYGGDNAPYTGGLVAVQFSADGSPVTTQDLFGPRNGQIDYGIAQGTAPHADSRQVIFYQTPSGLKLIESDDGGIWEKGLSQTDPWRSLSAAGLQTIEMLSGDWSSRGNVMIGAFQDNAASMGAYGDLTWTNVWAGDGNLGIFDDALLGSDGLSRSYYQSQQYMRQPTLFSTSVDDSGRWQDANALFLSTLDQNGNEVVLASYEAGWFNQVTGNGTYPFGLPTATNPYRAGDLVLAGARNLYEAVFPHWLSGKSEIITVPLLPSWFEDTIAPIVKQTLNNSGFRALDVGSSFAEVTALSAAKPYSWDALYTSYFDQSSNTSYLFGRPASVSTQALDPASYQLKLITEVPNAVVTGITHNPQAGSTNPTLYFLASNSSIRYFSQATNDPSLNQLGIIRGNGEPEYYTYAQLGLDPDLNLQTLVLLPETADYDAQLMVGGLGGAWLSTIQPDGSLGTFEAMDWQGLPANSGPGSWLLDLKYDPTDDVVMASTLGQGSWLWSRSGELLPAPARSPGFSVTSSLLPQALSNYFDRKGRGIYGLVSIQLVRTEAQIGQTVTAELVLDNATDWQTNLGIYTDISQTDDLTATIAATDNQIRIPLVFAPGVETLTLEVVPKRPELVLPEIALEMAVISDAFPATTAQGEIILYPNAGQPTYYQTNTEGVFYNYKSAFGLSGDLTVGGTAGDRLLTAVLPATLPQGTQIGYYLTNADGSIGSVLPSDGAYKDAVLSQFQSLAYATAPTDALSLTAERALNAFGDGDAFRETESRYFGNVQLSDAGLAFFGNTVGVALVLPDGSLYTSVGDNAFEFVPGAENTFVFDPTGDRLEASLAPAGGQVFVTESTDYQWKVARLGDYESGYGLFRVDNLTGLIDGITPGAPTYAAKALERALSQGVDGFTGQGLPEKGEYISQSLTGLAENAYYAAFITPDRPVDEALALLQAPSAGPSSEYVGFTIAGANQGTLASLPLGSSLFAFEDAGLFGDRDFNDLIMDLQPVSLNVA